MNLPLTTAMPIPPTLADELKDRFGERFSTAQSIRVQHGRGESPYPATPPDAVVFVQSNDEIQYVASQCNSHGVALIPHGAGSSLEGQLLATRGGLCIDLSAMNRILSLDEPDFTATVQAGVTREQLNTALKDVGLFFPVDPGAHATLGGMAATRASGTNTVRYGSMRENVLALTVVTADGSLVQTGTRAMKSAAGYDLTRLFVGSEGTLGVITEVTVRVYPLPEAVSAAIVTFADARSAVTTVIESLQAGMPLARGEYLCANSIRAILAADPGLHLSPQPTLFLEFHGSPTALQEQVELLKEIASSHGGSNFEWASRPEDRSRLWHARHNAYYACRQVRAGAQVVVTDTCVPRSRLAESITGAQTIMERATFPNMLFGHVGDGNFHVLMIVNPDSAAERDEAERLNEAIVGMALSMGGTCTGEHGIGLHKKEFLRREAGEPALALMQRIKQAIDPRGILNPDKIF